MDTLLSKEYGAVLCHYFEPVEENMEFALVSVITDEISINLYAFCDNECNVCFSRIQLLPKLMITLEMNLWKNHLEFQNLQVPFISLLRPVSHR